MAKTETVSLEKAAEAFIALHDSGNFNGRRYNRVLGMLRDAVHKKGVGGGPIMPDDERPDLSDDQEQAVEANVWDSARIHDLVHPAGRMQAAEESIDTILEKAKAGTLAQDEAREALAERRAERLKAAEKEEKAAAKPATKDAPAKPVVVHTTAGGPIYTGTVAAPAKKGG